LAEVENGGHNQFYFNSTGIVWKDALLGCRALRLDDVAQIITESASRMGGKPSLDRATRQGQLERSQPDFDDLDSRLYEVDSKIYEVIYQYILKNRSAFYFDGTVQKPIRKARGSTS